jgi:hypothetical protein
MFRSISLVLLSLAATFAFDGQATIDRVEEDWELVIKTTDVPAAGPQITTTMCPGPIEDHPDANFNLNYREGDTFQPGGLQIEVFDGQSVIAKANSMSDSLQTDDETITWTQKLSISGGTATYCVKSGQSTTWGNFGGADLTVTFESTLADLSSYSPAVSVERSGIGWQSDHVSSMRLLQVRYYSGDTLVTTDSTPRTVHPLTDP